MAHSLLDEHPPLVELAERRRALDRADAASRSRVESLNAAFAAEYEQWRAKHAAAAMNGERPPDPPPGPDLSAEVQAQQARQHARQQLAEERRRVLASDADELLDRLSAEERDDLSEAAGLVEGLLALQQREHERLNAAREIRTALDNASATERPSQGYSLTERSRQSVGLAELVDAVQKRRSLLEVEPPPGRDPGTPHAPREPVRLGVVREGTPPAREPFGRPPAPWPQASRRGVQI